MFQIYRWKKKIVPWNVWRFSTGWNALRTAVRVKISLSFPELSSEFVVLVWSFHQVGSLLIWFQSCEIWESLVAKSGILWSSFTIFYLKAQRLCFFLCLSLSASANRCEHVLLKRWVKKKKKEKKWTAGGGSALFIQVDRDIEVCGWKRCRACGHHHKLNRWVMVFCCGWNVLGQAPRKLRCTTITVCPHHTSIMASSVPVIFISH